MKPKELKRTMTRAMIYAMEDNRARGVPAHETLEVLRPASGLPENFKREFAADFAAWHKQCPGGLLQAARDLERGARVLRRLDKALR